MMAPDAMIAASRVPFTPCGTPGYVSAVLQAGDSVDRFVVEAHAGSGATADVYRVRHGLLGTLHALKVIRAVGAGDRFRREARAQAAVRHRNVVAVTDAFVVEGAPALLLEWVPGTSLAEHIPDGGLRTDIVDQLFRGVVEGVAAVHAAGIVHRDLKPANVMLCDGVPRVADFGLAKLLDGLGDPLQTRAGMILGTPCYMSPEQAEGSVNAGPASDVWGLGAILYEMLSGRRLFAGEYLHDVLDAVRAGRWTPLPTASRQHAEVLSLCLARHPHARPADARALLAVLGGAGADIREVLRAEATAVPEVEQWQVVLGNLPPERSSFVARPEEIAAIEDRFANGAQLVSLVGPGGAGKTRLSLAWARAADSAGGAWFVDLTDARSSEGVVAAMAQALGIVLSGSTSGEHGNGAQLGRALASRGEMLVVLDNFEQVVAAAAETVGRWMAEAPRVRFLVTTRERLQLEGEATVAAGSLSQEAAERLFDARSRTADPAWDATRYRDEVRAILARLDRMPLAIELAAARVRLLAPPELLRRLSAGAGVLRSSRRDVSDRQASVEGAIAWSWALLTPPEQSAFAQLSRFRGGFTLEAAEAVLDVSEIANAPAPWELVLALVDKSLLRRWEFEAEARFGMYVTVTDFAAARLAESPIRTSTEQRFVDYWVQRGPELAELAKRADDLVPLRRLLVEEENLRVAYEIATQADSEQAIPIFHAIERLLWGGFGDGSPRHRAFTAGESYLRHLARSASPRIRAELRAMYLRWNIYRLSADESDRELAALRADGMDSGELDAISAMIYARRAALAGDIARAELLYARASPLVERYCRTFETFRVHAWWGSLMGSLGRWPEREAAYARLIERARADHDRWTEIIVLTNRGAHRGEAGGVEAGEADYRQALALARAVGLAKFVDVNVGNLGSAAWAAGNISEARRLLALAVERELASGHGGIAASCAAELAWVHELLGATADAEAAVAIAKPDEVARLHEYDRASTWRLLCMWRFTRGDLAGAFEALVLAESVVAANAHWVVVLQRLRKAIGIEAAALGTSLPDTTGPDWRIQGPAIVSPDASVVAVLDRLIEAGTVKTIAALSAAIADVSVLNIDGQPGPTRAAAHVAKSSLERMAAQERTTLGAGEG